MKKLYAPTIDNYLDWLSHRHKGLSNNSCLYDEDSYHNLNKLFEQIKILKPISSNGCRELWLCVERGKIEDFADYKEWHEMGYVQDYGEFEKTWKDYYPYERKWYHFAAVADEDCGYKAVFMNYKLILEVSKEKEQGYPFEVSEFTRWLLDIVTECCDEIENGDYNHFVKENLPYECRTGTIQQKFLWEIFPEEKTEFFSGINADDVHFFLEHALCFSKHKIRLPIMTANMFYNYCSIGYKAMGYDGIELSPKLQYYKHSDGRDDGLSDIDADSAEAFSEWYNNRQRIGHPWEVCRGGNSTHISLYIGKDRNGYYLELRGSSYSRTNETIKFFNALEKAGVPVILHDAQNLVDRVKGVEKVGVVPRGIIPTYRNSDFPDESVISFMNLPFEHEAEVAEKCIWHEIEEITLIKEEK